VKYIFIGKQKVVLYPKLRKNQRKAAASALKGWLNGGNLKGELLLFSHGKKGGFFATNKGGF
jgi:hypothetical protein